MAGQLRLDDGISQGDVDGDGVADFEIEMAGVAALGGGDFLLRPRLAAATNLARLVSCSRP